MGCRPGPVQREGRNVWRLLRWSHTDARGDGGAASSRFDLSLRDRIRVLRWLDLSKRGFDAVVQQFVDLWSCHRHPAPPGRINSSAKGMGKDSAPSGLSATQSAAALITGAVFSRLVIT